MASLLLCLGIRCPFAGAGLASAHHSHAIIGSIAVHTDRVARHTPASDSPCVPYQVFHIRLPASTGVLQLLSPAAPPRLLTQSASSPRASPCRLS
ncbi:MAG TPA: hypothetical protein VF799_08085 [Geobacteraceae bacterium]